MRLLVVLALITVALIIWMINARVRYGNAKAQYERALTTVQTQHDTEVSAWQAACDQIQAPYAAASNAVRDELFPDALNLYYEAQVDADLRYQAAIRQYGEDYPLNPPGRGESYAEWAARNSAMTYPPPGPDQSEYQVALTDFYDADAVEAELLRRRRSGEFDLPDQPRLPDRPTQLQPTWGAADRCEVKAARRLVALSALATVVTGIVLALVWHSNGPYVSLAHPMPPPKEVLSDLKITPVDYHNPKEIPKVTPLSDGSGYTLEAPNYPRITLYSGLLVDYQILGGLCRDKTAGAIEVSGVLVSEQGWVWDCRALIGPQEAEIGISGTVTIRWTGRWIDQQATAGVVRP